MKKTHLVIIMLSIMVSMYGCKKSSSKGTITVNVTKYTNQQTSSGPIIPATGASVRVTITHGGEVGTKITSSSGQVVFDGLEAGSYDVSSYIEVNQHTWQGSTSIALADKESKTISLLLD